MWVDEAGVMHTAWVPPEEILGELSVSALRAVPAHVAEAAVTELHRRYQQLFDEVMREATPGPADVDEDNVDSLPYPPVFPGLAPQPGEPLATTVMSFLARVPAQWRIEAIEAIYDVLEPIDDEVEPTEPEDAG